MHRTCRRSLDPQNTSLFKFALQRSCSSPSQKKKTVQSATSLSMSTKTPEKLYTIKEIPYKGMGFIAARKIEKGERILSEAPLIRVPRSTVSKTQVQERISREVAALSQDERQSFFALHNAFKDKETRELGIVHTNALPFGSNASAGGVFVQASRINHACLQNSQNTWNEDLQQLTIHAFRDIEKGEEITLFYLHDRTNYSQRRRALQQRFRFTCSCQLCSMPPPQRAISDAKLDEIQRLDELIGDGARMTVLPLDSLHDIRKLLQLCEEEHLEDASVPRAYYDAFQIAIYNGDEARARLFADRACKSRVILEGSDSPTVRKMSDLARDPTNHSFYGSSSRWRSSTNDIPSGLSSKDFDAWLWKEKSKMPSRDQTMGETPYANLRNDVTFPSFDALPEENGLDLRFFESEDGYSYHPRKHWCFLAEIVSIEIFMRLRFYIEDKTKRKTSVSFYTDDRGRELKPSVLKEGYTVAILYPEQHGFLDMTVGIRHENRSLLKVSLLALLPC